MVPFGKKLLAGLSAASPERWDEGTLGERYESAKDRLAKGFSAAKKANPKTYMAGQVASAIGQGAVGPAMRGAGLLGAAKQGATYGALEGASGAEGGVGDYAGSIATGVVLGGLLGPVVGAAARPVVRGAAKLGSYLPGKIGAVARDVSVATGKNRRALTDITKTVEKGGETLEGMAKKSQALTKTPGSGRKMAEEAALDLQQSGKQFEGAYKAASEITDPELDRFLSDGAGAGLWRSAQAEAKKRGRDLPVKAGSQYTDEVLEMAARADKTKPGDGARFLAQLGESGIGGRKEIPIPDPEALHFMRQAAAKDVKLKEAYQVIKDAVGKHTPDLDAAINDYAEKARKFDVLHAGLKADKSISAKADRPVPLSTKASDPVRLRKVRTGPKGLESSLDNMTPDEQQLFRTTAQDRLGELLQSGRTVGDKANNETWQRAIFGSPEMSEVFALGQRAQPEQGFVKGLIEDATEGWLPHSSRGYAAKGLQVLSRAARGRPHLTGNPMSIDAVLGQALARQRGQGSVDVLRNALLRKTLHTE
jgi:hypothetical protein